MQVINELRDRIYTALRDDGLDAELIVELACLLEELEVSTPATREILERPLAQLTGADLTRLGECLLKETNHEPTFALDPSLWAGLEQALAVVERDVRTTGITGTLELIISDWDDTGQAWVEFRGIRQGNGISPSQGPDAQAALASVADATQEVIIEMIWAAWPICHTHNRGLRAGLEDDLAIWWCTGAGTHTVAPVGQLSPPVSGRARRRSQSGRPPRHL